ncbi:erythromycin esterase family protein [Flavobacteriaceae bacterium]|nr:erythromycin esterase family protein [Flavobacteriaceae bacterium]
MIKNIAIVLLSFVSTILSAQTKPNLSDLSPLENTKIVLLGEQTHFDGAVFDKKVEIIKYLHQKLGFNIITFESGFYDNYKAQQLYQSKKENISIYNQSIFPMWTETSAFKELLDYVEQYPEMKILGFDNQETSLFKEYFIPDLRNLLNKNLTSLSDKVYTQLEKTLVYRDLDDFVNNKKDSLELYKTFNKIKNQLSNIENKNLHTKIIQQTFISVVSDFDFTLKLAQEEKIYVQNPRDKQMAGNLIFLQKQFPNEKIISWGASYHFSNHLNNYEYTKITENYITKLHKLSEKLTSHSHSTLEEEVSSVKDIKYAVTMGKILKEYYGDKLYSIGFTSYNGTYYGADKVEFPVLKPPINSLESILFAKNTIPQLIDKSNYPKNEFYSSSLGYLPIFAKWNTVFDGIYYIPEMYPPKYRDYDEKFDTTFISKVPNLNGVIIDSESNLPIPYVDVYYSSNNKSSIANSKGKFNIPKSKQSDDYLVFSSFGYKSDSLQVNIIESTNPIKITLQKSENGVDLNEVIVIGKRALTAKEIIKRAKQKIEDNYVQTPFNQNFFYKVQQYRKDSLVFNEEALIETYFKKGNNGTNNPENNIFGNVTELRNTTKNYSTKKENGIGNLWPILIRDIILSKTNVLYRSPSYELKKESSIDYNGRKVYKISFLNNSPGSYSTGYGYPSPLASSGVIYIDKQNFAVLYYEHCVAREKYTSKHSKYKFQRFHKIVQSYKEINRKYFINLFKVIEKTNYYSKSDNTFLSSSYMINNLMSTDIEFQNVKTIERPIRDIKQKVKLDLQTDFWKNNIFYIEDSSYEFENCE